MVNHPRNIYLQNKLNNQLSMEEFPLCCGIKVINGFGYSHNNVFLQDFPKKLIDERLDYLISLSKKVGLVLIALASEQVLEFNDLLISKGFKPAIKDFYHPGHESYITLYALENYPEKNKNYKKEEECSLAKEPTKKRKSFFSTQNRMASLEMRQKSM